jgi:hypothetical protein
MKIQLRLAAVPLVLAAAVSAYGQGMPTDPPKILQVTVEYLKPGKAGMPHDKTESAFVAAMTRAKFPTHYIALNSMSGKVRALYLTGYSTFAAWEKDNKAIDANHAFSAELDHAAQLDGELLDEMSQTILTYSEEMSFHPRADISRARYFEITVFHVKPGKGKEWRELVKLARDANEKGHTSAHWALYDVAYGMEDGTYVAFSSDVSMADIDTGFAENKQFVEALGGEDGLSKFRTLSAEAIASSRSELFSINPHQSYAPPEWIKADPDFWKPKPAMAPEAKPAAKDAKPAAH